MSVYIGFIYLYICFSFCLGRDVTTLIPTHALWKWEAVQEMKYKWLNFEKLEAEEKKTNTWKVWKVILNS